MRVLIVYKEDYPWDVRVEKLAKSLVSRGHEVLIFCRNLDQKPVFEYQDNICIRRLPRTTKYPSFIRKLVNFPLWLNPLWAIGILKAMNNLQNNVIIVRDLPLVAPCLLCGWLHKVKVVFDMAECYPEMYESARKFSNLSKMEKLIKSPFYALIYEKISVVLVDHIFVMIEESRDRLLRKGIPDNKVTIVSNTPSLRKRCAGNFNHTGGDLRIIYVGFLTALRGLDLLVHSVKNFLDKNDTNSITVDIIGKGPEYFNLKRLVNILDIQENVKIHGWLAQNDVDHLLRKANVGALTYRVCGHWNHTIPNKIFDYMLNGLPVIVTKVKPVARIVTNYQCGIVCPQNPQGIASGLNELIDPSLRNLYGHNGREAIFQSFNWVHEEKKLFKVVESLA